jgi:C1A family cysteine protease
MDAEYPYAAYYDTDDTPTCHADRQDFKITIDAAYQITAETDMEAYVKDYGPLSVCVDASEWSSYAGGVLSTCGDVVDHCVQVTGIVYQTGAENYYIIRNSWGTHWGYRGYMYMEAGVNMCNVTSMATFTTPSQV